MIPIPEAWFFFDGLFDLYPLQGQQISIAGPIPVDDVRVRLYRYGWWRQDRPVHRVRSIHPGNSLFNIQSSIHFAYIIKHDKSRDEVYLLFIAYLKKMAEHTANGLMCSDLQLNIIESKIMVSNQTTLFYSGWLIGIVTPNTIGMCHACYPFGVSKLVPVLTKLPDRSYP
jgi:hypothetical protein